MPKFERFYFRDLGIIFFEATCRKDESFSIESPVTSLTFDVESVPIILHGSFRVFSTARDTLDLEALDTRAEGGIAFPGVYRFKALEDNSVYLCTGFLPKYLIGNLAAMVKLEHNYLKAGEELSLRRDEGYVAALVMSGSIGTADKQAVGKGGVITVNAGQSISLTAQEDCHLVRYKRQ